MNKTNKKLGQWVFEQQDNQWQSAAVNSDGTVYLHDCSKEELTRNELFHHPNHEITYSSVKFGDGFDANDWENSPINRKRSFMAKDKLPINRFKLADRRRFVIYLSDLCTMANLSYSNTAKSLTMYEFRQDIDYAYNTKRNDYALSLATAQSLLILELDHPIDVKKIWSTYHAITDFLIKGFKK